MFLAGPAPLPGEYRFLRARATCCASCPPTRPSATLVAVDCANESRIGADPAVLHLAPFTLNIDHHHDNSRFGDVDLVDAAGILDRARCCATSSVSSASS